jgi:hypothetical protein
MAGRRIKVKSRGHGRSFGGVGLDAPVTAHLWTSGLACEGSLAHACARVGLLNHLRELCLFDRVGTAVGAVWVLAAQQSCVRRSEGFVLGGELAHQHAISS